MDVKNRLISVLFQLYMWGSDCVWATEKERSLNYQVPPNVRFSLGPENICCEQASKLFLTPYADIF